MRRLLLAVVFVAGCGHEEAAKPAAPVANAAPPVAPAAPVETGLDESAIDSSVKPCDDFYQYACGNWMKRTEIPADKSTWGRGFSVIDEHNEDEMHQILEAAAKGQVQSQYGDKIGALYSSCMDEAGIEASAPMQLKQQMKRIDIIRDLAALQKEVARMHLSLGNPMFEFSQDQDFKNSSEVIGSLDQGGIGMPDRDYYLSTTGKMPEIRKAYTAHVEKMLTLAGVPAAQAAKDAATVLKIETALAQASMSRTDRRDPNKVYHRIELAGIEKTAPKWNWKAYLKEMGVPEVTAINVTSPDFFAALNKMLTATPIAEWKTYLKWHLVHNTAPALSKAFVDENFAFYGKTLSGTTELEVALEALHQGGRPADGRGARARVRGEDVRRRGQGAHAEDGARDRGVDEREPRLRSSGSTTRRARRRTRSWRRSRTRSGIPTSGVTTTRSRWGTSRT